MNRILYVPLDERACNYEFPALLAGMKEACEKNGMKIYYPSPILCTDNAVMIGCAAYYEYKAGTRHGLDLNAMPNLRLGERGY